MIVFGALIAGVRDFSFDAYGYGIVFLANFTTAIYLATISRIGWIPIPHSFIKWKFYTLFPCQLELFYLSHVMSFSQEKVVVLIALALCGAMVS